MLVNTSKETNHVKFVSYSGRYPNLCSGALVLEIDGLEYTFGHEHGSYNFKTNKFKDGNYDPFWSSTGGLLPDYEGAYQGEWRIDMDRIPEQFRKYAAEIDEVFNANVEWGCCGGCI